MAGSQLIKHEWFTLNQLAEMALPGLPKTRQGLQKFAQRQRWEKTASARERTQRGGGLEYHYTLLPDVAQVAVVARHANFNSETSASKAKKTQLAPYGGIDPWKYYEEQPQNRKDEAARRIKACAKFDEINHSEGITGALAIVAEENGVSPATLRNWLNIRKKVAREYWLPALVPEKRGKPRPLAEIDPKALEALKTDYLRLSEPSLPSCRRRLERVAADQGWKLASERTLRRRIDELPAIVRVIARKGNDAAKKTYRAQERDRSHFHALQAVNADGHKWDVFVRYDDGKIGRPVMLAFQDLYSGKFLSWRYGRGENKDMVRLAFGDMCMSWGIPEKCWLDNGRAFASKWLTGGIPNRYRFKVKAEEPLGILTQLGVEIHWTTVYAGQSKPIERGFGDFARDIARAPQFQGAWTGNTPMAKPEDYASRAIPFAEFKTIIDHEIMLHNARPGRLSRTCGGKLSFNEAFEASYATALIQKPTPEQVRICLLAAEGVRARQMDGSIHLLGNRYWHERLVDHRGKLLTVRFDPDQVQADLPIYGADGALICVALLVEAAGFDSSDAAREHQAARKTYLRAGKEMLAAARVMSLAELVALQPRPAAPAAALDAPAEVIRPSFRQPPVRRSEAEEDETQDHFAAGLAKWKQAQGEF